MIRIALVIGHLGLGGAEKQVCQLAVGLARRNYQPLVIALSEGGQRGQRLQSENVEVLHLSRNGSFDLQRVFQLVSALRRFKPEIVHGFDYGGSTYGRLAGALAGVPALIGGVRSEWTPPRRILHLERWLRFKTDAVISNSFAGKRVWMKLAGYPDSKIKVIPNGFDFAEMSEPNDGIPSLREILGLRSSDLLVGCIGSIYDLKNPLMLLDMAASVLARRDNVHFVWIGDGPMRCQVETAIEERGLSRAVHLLGARADAPWLAREFQIGVLTSVVEGFPNALMEYMFWGVPVVTTDAGDCGTVVQHGQTGFVVGKNDVSGMSMFIEQLLQDQCAARQMGLQGRERLEKEYSTQTMLDRTIALYEEVGQRKQASLARARILSKPAD